jgi:arsenite/tail-anchored protein-transporting ATPase
MARESFAFIRDASQPYLFIGGKGGTGKTTCAAAAAIALAEQGRRLLVVSTDPAHSLGDVLGQKLSARPSQVAVRRGQLSACELDADRALTRWLRVRRPALATIVERGTILERCDIDPFLNLSLPGVDELLGLLEIERLAADDEYDHVVIDTAPTGHTLRLLATPAIFTTFARVLDLMLEKHRVLATAFGHAMGGNGAEAIVEELRHDGERLGALLRDRSQARLCWVLLPEEMSVAESGRAVAALRGDGIQVSDIIVNRLTPAPPTACGLCDGRRRSEAKWIAAISTRWSRRNVGLWGLTARDEPPQGIAALRAVAQSVLSLARPATRLQGRRTTRAATAAPSRKLLTLVQTARATRLQIVGGKGGVGKTTCAASLALAIAQETPTRRVLLVSTDPAPSIGDVLGQAVGDVERRVQGGPGNLVVREIDAVRDWQARRERYRESVRQVFEALSGTSNVDLSVDRAIIEELLELAPPGTDEIVGMLTIVEALLPRAEATVAADTRQAAGRFDLVIVDSAPTGHTLRLLALPQQAQAWVRQLMAVVLKYKAVTGFDLIATELISLSRGLRRLQTLLTNPRACGFIVVTRPEELPALETLRLIEWLRQHEIGRRALIVNGVTPPGCARCRRSAARERRQIAAFTNRPAWKRAGCEMILAAAIAPPPRGIADLTRWQGSWRTSEAAT